MLLFCKHVQTDAIDTVPSLCIACKLQDLVSFCNHVMMPWRKGSEQWSCFSHHCFPVFSLQAKNWLSRNFGQSSSWILLNVWDHRLEKVVDNYASCSFPLLMQGIISSRCCFSCPCSLRICAKLWQLPLLISVCCGFSGHSQTHNILISNPRRQGRDFGSITNWTCPGWKQRWLHCHQELYNCTSFHGMQGLPDMSRLDNVSKQWTFFSKCKKRAWVLTN